MRSSTALLLLAGVGVSAQVGMAPLNLALLALLLGAVAMRRQLQAPRDLVLPVAAFIGASLFHVIVGTEALQSWGYATHSRVVLVLILAGAIAAHLSAGQRLKVLCAVLITMALSVAYSFYQVFAETVGPLQALHPHALDRPIANHRDASAWLTFSINGLRGTGMIHHILSFAHVSCMLALAAAAQAVFGKGKSLVWALFSVIGVCGVMVSGARAALVGFVIGSSVLGLLYFLRSARSRRFAVVLCVLAIFSGFFVVSMSPDLRQRIGSFSSRQVLWTQGVKALSDSFPRGIGFGAYPHYAERVYASDEALENQVKAWAHNTWLSLLAEAPLTVPALIWLLVALFRRALAQFERGLDSAWAAAVLASLMSWLVICLFHDSHFQREYFPLVLWLWGLGLSPAWATKE
jgi:hypothetical protein